MAITVHPVTDEGLCAQVWRQLAEKANHPVIWHPWTGLGEYEEWKRYLERGVGAFWALQGERLAILAATDESRPQGLVRLLQVPIYPWQRQDYGADTVRGEIQDLLYEPDRSEVAVELVKAAIAFLRGRALGKIGASAWRPDQCEVLGALGFRPLRRSVLLRWSTAENLQHTLKIGAEMRYVKSGEETLVQEVFSSTWGFPVTFLPRMEVQQALVALITGKPVGAALLNRHTGNVDLGVQIVAEYRRKGIGTRIVQEALDYCRNQGWSRMYVVRNLPVNGLGAEDEVALCFYIATGATLLREYTGFLLA